MIIKPGVDAPQAVYRAFNAQRQELAQQLENLEDKRRGLMNQLQDHSINGVNKTGIEQRVVEVDKRIADVDKQLAAADQAVAKQAAVPGAVPPPDPPRERNGPPEEVFVLSGIFMFVVFFPLSIAWRGASGVAARQRPSPFRRSSPIGSTGSIRRWTPLPSKWSASAKGSGSSRA